MKFDYPAQNYLTPFNNSNAPSPGTIVDVDILDDGKILTLFSTTLKLFTFSGREMSSIDFEEKSLSLGRYVQTFVVSCVSKTMCFVKIVDSKLIMYRKIRSETQFTGAYGLTAKYLLCIAENEPTLYVFNDDMQCVSTRDLRYYGVRMSSLTSARRICLNFSGRVVVSDYANNYVLVFWNAGDDAIVHKVDCPANIAADERYIYIVQDKHKNQVLEVCLDNHRKKCLLKEEHGIVYPNCVSVNMHDRMLVGMDCTKPLVRGYIFQTRA